MTLSQPLPQGGRRPGRPRMARERIVAAALDLAREEGAAALSFRSLADRLGSSTATLYRHFSDRAELVADVVDAILAEVDLEVVTADVEWDGRLFLLCEDLFETLVRHRRAAPLFAERIPTGPHAMTFRETCLRTLVDVGFTPGMASTAAATMGRFTLGFAIQLTEAEPSPSVDQSMSSPFENVDEARYPAIHALAAHMPVALGTEFRFGLRLMLAGLAQVAEVVPPPQQSLR